MIQRLLPPWSCLVLWFQRQRLSLVPARLMRSCLIGFSLRLVCHSITPAVPVASSFAFTMARRSQSSSKAASVQALTPLSERQRPVPVTPEPQSSLQASLTSELIASVNPLTDFVDLSVAANELRPSATLTTGQCFHWRAVSSSETVERKESAWGTHDAKEWIGTLRHGPVASSVVVIRETPSSTHYRVLATTDQSFDVGGYLRKYFQLSIALAPLYEQWSEQCPRLAEVAQSIPGVRLVDQDPFECLISFICSSNNNIPRITKMLSALRERFGKPLLTIGDETFCSFPSLDELTGADEQELRKLGLGYRAKYIVQTIEILVSLGGESYLLSLRSKNAEEVQEALLQFSGVGRKVADCVALFSLCQASAIPVDIHVWNIARRDYDHDGTLASIKSLTPANYKLIGDLFRNRFRSRPGWAHSLLFVAELPSFRPVLPAALAKEMDAVRYMAMFEALTVACSHGVTTRDSSRRKKSPRRSLTAKLSELASGSRRRLYLA